MERNFNPIIFVKVDLLLHEESFKALKEFVCQDTTTKTYSSLLNVVTSAAIRITGWVFSSVGVKSATRTYR